MSERAAKIAAEMIAAEAVPGYDADDPLAPIKKAVKDAASQELIPGSVAEVIEKMAAFGMDAATRLTVRAYLKREKSLGVGAGQFDSILEEVRKARKRARDHTSPPPLPSADDAHLHTPPSWASDQDILKRMVRTLRVCTGLVGETRNAKLTYLAIASRLLDKQVSVVVKGLSSSGKSFTIECVVLLFPAEAVYTMTAMSERALIYLDESLSHRTLVLYEATALREGREKTDDNQTAYIVRSLLSEGQIEYPVVVRQDDGSLRTEKLVVPGPTNLVTSTTSISLHPENETRMLSLPSNDSKAQTRAVLLMSSDDDALARKPDVSEWHDYQRWLASSNRTVTIPFARCVAAQISPAAVRLRRDWNTVRALIRTHAMLHQLSRATDEHGRIIATLDDYEAIRSLVSDLVAEGIGATVPSTVRQTVETVERLNTPSGVTVAAVARDLKLERSAATRRLHTARDRGYLANLEDKPGKPARYYVDDPMPGDEAVLPPRDRICTGRCEHVAEDTAAGQECDCTGVCRCAGLAEGSGGGVYNFPPASQSAGGSEVPGTTLPPVPRAEDAHLHTPPDVQSCDACGQPGTRYLTGETLCDSCRGERKAAQRAARLAAGDESACQRCGGVLVIDQDRRSLVCMHCHEAAGIQPPGDAALALLRDPPGAEVTEPAANGSSAERAECIAPGPAHAARRGCATCWEHAAEYEPPRDGAA